MAYPAELFASIPNKNPNLFRCEKNGKSFLLFGTYHVISLSTLPKDVLDIMLKSQKLVLESLHEPWTESVLIKAGLIHPKVQSENSYKGLTPVARETLEMALKLFNERHKLSIPFTRLVLERAIWIARFCINYGGMDFELEYSNLFKEKFGLEKRGSISFETTTLDTLNKSLVESFGCLRKPPEYPEDVLAEMDEYLMGNSLSHPGYCYQQEQNALMVTSRNKKWISEIVQHHAGKNTSLIAVGHTHLVGTSGLLCLLQQSGFKIFQYDAKAKRFEIFMPDLLFKPTSANYGYAKRIETVVDELVECRFKATTPELSSSSSSSSLSQAQSAIYGCVMEYWEPEFPIVFSDIYPEQKNTAESTKTTTTQKMT